VFDQAEKVGAGRDQGTADVVLGQALQLPEQRVSRVLQVAAKVRLRIKGGHADILPLAGGEVRAAARAPVPASVP